MRPYMEYMRRHELLKRFFRPCSFPVHRYGSPADNKHRKMVAIHPVEDQDKLLVKTWHVDTCPLEFPLPPCESTYLTKNEILSGKAIPNGFVVSWFPGRDAIPAGLNLDNHPIKEKVFNNCYDNILIDPYRKEMITFWLWECFRNAFDHKINIRLDRMYDPSIPRSIVIEEEMNVVKIYSPRYWQYFDMWKMHMNNYEDIEVAPELVVI